MKVITIVSIYMNWKDYRSKYWTKKKSILYKNLKYKKIITLIKPLASLGSELLSPDHFHCPAVSVGNVTESLIAVLLS